MLSPQQLCISHPKRWMICCAWSCKYTLRSAHAWDAQCVCFGACYVVLAQQLGLCIRFSCRAYARRDRIGSDLVSFVQAVCYADAKKPLSGALTLPIVGADARKVRNVLRCPGRVRLKPARLWTYGTVLPQVVAQGGSAVIGQLRLHFSVFTPFRHDHNLGSVRS
jgi:hypothetical protein